MNKKSLGKPKQILNWLKRKLLIIITAFMLEMSNTLNDEDKSVFGNQYNIEQRDRK
tara:strand:- start:18171 stop:18338 length:168 start_codon:yes stop_codon:yes gene_type:complete